MTKKIDAPTREALEPSEYERNAAAKLRRAARRDRKITESRERREVKRDA